MVAEINQIATMPAKTGHRAGQVDMLVKVGLLTGDDQWIFLQFEVQSGRETAFESRIARYNGGLYWIFKQRVVSLVILADLDEQWRPGEDLFRLADFEFRLRLPVCKLAEKVDRSGGRTIRRSPSKSPAPRSPPSAPRGTRKVGIVPSGNWYATCATLGIMQRNCERSSA